MSLKPTHNIKVHVSGTIDVPLNLAMLENLQDAQLAQEVLQEAVKLAIAEKLGQFDGVSFSSDPCLQGHEGAANEDDPEDRQAMATATASLKEVPCRAELDLAKLGECITAIQEAYNYVMGHVLGLREMLADDSPGRVADAQAQPMESGAAALGVRVCGNKDCELNRAAMLTVLDAVLQGPTSVVDAAVMEHEKQKATEDAQGSAQRSAGRENDSSSEGEGDTAMDEEPWDYRTQDPKAQGYKPLLQDDQDESSEEAENENPDSDTGEHMDYGALGYTAL